VVFFPAQSLTLLREQQADKRYHVHESVVQKAIKHSVNHAKLIKIGYESKSWLGSN